VTTPWTNSSLSKDADAEMLDTLVSEQQRIRESSRATLGVTGVPQVKSLRSGMRTYGVAWYPLLAVGGLVLADQFQLYAFQVLGPDISTTLGLSAAALGTGVAINQLCITVGALPMAAYTQKRPRRALILISCGFAWTLATLFTGFVVSIWGILLVLSLGGIASGSTRTVQPALLMDSYPPPMRMRTQAFHRGAWKGGQILAPLLVGLITVWMGLTWRAVFLLLSVVALGASLLSLGLRDPGPGKWEEAPVRQQVRERLGVDDSATEDAAPALNLHFFEVMGRLLRVPSVRRILAAYAVFGVWLIPLETFIFFFLAARWGMGPGARGLFLAGTSVFGVVGLLWYGRRGEALFQKDPADLVVFTSKVAVVMVISLMVAVWSPNVFLLVLLFGVATAAGAIVFPTLLMLMMSIVRPSERTHAVALGALFLDGVGGLGGVAVLGGLDRRFGIATALILLSVPGCIAAAILRSTTNIINADLDRVIDEIVESQEIRTLQSQGVHLPMLACRHIDFAYSGVQVLFDVNFAVEEGEMVALLGTNGAGKSTLLRVVSGLGIPDNGRVHFGGNDISYLDCERRLALGVALIPSGRAVFSSLSVVDNLRIYGYSHGRKRGAVERGIEATFEAFPALARRRNHTAVTLSGGEQQMLALGKALMVRPRLLLIDELSLGLAPKVVSGLLGMVRSINDSGTAVVLVEQSVNIALSLVEHAYFMEKGEIRFDGPARELLGRRDLLRSVFLEGATKAIT
jgi:ABC-type branched-subunit amino acid transport system ATPase component/MFS family permease